MDIDIKDLLKQISKKIDNSEYIDYEILVGLLHIEYSIDLKESCLFFEWFIKLNADKEMLELSDITKKKCMKLFNNINYRIENSMKYYNENKDNYKNELRLLNEFSILIRKFYYGIGLVKEKPIDNRNEKVQEINISS
jgi:hypothetical protein